MGVLGALGLGLLFYTVISLMQKIEAAFNLTWRVSRQRTLAKRFSDYLSIIVVGPVLVFSALGIAASLAFSLALERFTEIAPLGVLIELMGRFVPYALVIAAFAFT